MALTHVNQRVQKHRDMLREAGLRPVQLWVPDTRRAGFEAECRRQSALASASDQADHGLMELLDQSLNDLDGWEA